MKFYLLTFSCFILLFSSYSEAHHKCRTHDPTKPRHCHKPVVSSVEKGPRWSMADHALVGATLGTIVAGGLLDHGVRKKYATAAAVLAAVVVERARERREHRDDAAFAAGSAALLSNIFVFDY